MSGTKLSVRMEKLENNLNKYPFLINFPMIWKRMNDGYSNGILTIEKENEIVGVTLLYYHDISNYIDIDIMEVTTKNVGIGSYMLSYLKKISDNMKSLLSVHPYKGTELFFLKNGFRKGDKYVLPLTYGGEK